MTSPITLSDAVRSAILYQLNVIHTSFPGIIISYDYTTQKAAIQPALDKIYTNGTTAAMPVLNEVPVIFPRSGGASLTFPILAGDTVLVVCSERSLNNWINTGGRVVPQDTRKFDLSDAIAIPGLYPFSQISPSNNNTDVLLQYAGSSITLTPAGGIKLDGALSVALGSSNLGVEVLSTLITFLNVASAAFTAPPYTAVGLAAGAASTALSSIDGSLP